MSELNYITELLELKDNNIKFYKNCYYKEKIKGVYHKVFEGILTYQPVCCEKCGVIFDNNFEKFKLKKLVATKYNQDGTGEKYELFIENDNKKYYKSNKILKF